MLKIVKNYAGNMIPTRNFLFQSLTLYHKDTTRQDCRKTYSLNFPFWRKRVWPHKSLVRLTLKYVLGIPWNVPLQKFSLCGGKHGRRGVMWGNHEDHLIKMKENLQVLHKSYGLFYMSSSLSCDKTLDPSTKISYQRKIPIRLILT